jgi:hypothetical protein
MGLCTHWQSDGFPDSTLVEEGFVQSRINFVRKNDYSWMIYLSHTPI